MTKSIFKAIGKGIFIGAALFFAPRLLLAIFLVIMIMRFFMHRRLGVSNFYGHRFAMADRIRSMSDDEYDQYKTSSNPCHHHPYKTEKDK